MARNGSGIYSAPAGTTATADTIIESAKYNTFVADLVTDANTARPIVAGGTGATTVSAARTSLGLVIGSDVQAYDAALTTLAGLGVSAVSGADGVAVTGTAGTADYTAKWNSDGDLVDGYEVLDEDDMASDSATKLATQQSVKAYVDAKVDTNDRWEIISETTVSNDATIDFTGFDAARFNDYRIEMRSVLPSTDGVQLYLRFSTDGGSTYDAGTGYDWIGYGIAGGLVNDNHVEGTSQIVVAGPGNNIGTAAGEYGVTGSIEIMRPDMATDTVCEFSTTYRGNLGKSRVNKGWGHRMTTTAVDAARLFASSGNLASGSITFMGRRK